MQRVIKPLGGGGGHAFYRRKFLGAGLGDGLPGLEVLIKGGGPALPDALDRKSVV